MLRFKDRFKSHNLTNAWSPGPGTLMPGLYTSLSARMIQYDLLVLNQAIVLIFPTFTALH